MRQGVVVLRSLSELAAVRDRFAAAGPVPETRALVPVIGGSGPAAVGELARAAREAVGELEALVAGDREQRRGAQRGLSRVRAAQGEAARLRRVAAELGEAAGRATAFAGAAFGPAARRRADGVAARAGRLATQAEAQAAVLEREAEVLAARGDVARLLAEERAQHEEVRMREALERAGEHLDAGRAGEARRLLDSVKERTGSAPDLERTVARLRRRQHEVSTEAAEAALREARRLRRREPARAIEILESVELAGLADELVRHLYGCWLSACGRLGLVAAIHYRAGFGRGAVLIPTADGRWEVVSAIGLRRWESGRRFAPRALRGARPLS